MFAGYALVFLELKRFKLMILGVGGEEKYHKAVLK